MLKFFRLLKNMHFSIDGQCPQTQRGRPVGVDEGGAAGSELSLCEKTTKKGRKIYYKTKQQKEIDKKGKEITKQERAKSGGKLRGRISKATKETIAQRINEMKEIVKKMSGFKEGPGYNRPDISKMPRLGPEENERIDVKPSAGAATPKKEGVDFTTDLGDTTSGLSDSQLKTYESRIEYNKKLEKDFEGGSYGFLGKEIEKSIPELSGVKKVIGMGEQLIDGSFADSGTINLGDVAKWLDRKPEWEERHANLAKVLLQVSRLHGRGEHALNNDYVSEKDVKKAMGMLGFLANKGVISSKKEEKDQNKWHQIPFKIETKYDTGIVGIFGDTYNHKELLKEYGFRFGTYEGRPFWYHPKSWNVKDKENFVSRFGELGKKLSEKEANVNFKVID